MARCPKLDVERHRGFAVGGVRRPSEATDVVADFDEFLRFVEVAEAGSFAGAARRLNVSRQAVQRSLEQLEHRSGVQLLERSTRQLRLTDAGRRLLPAAYDLRTSARQAEAILSGAAEAPRGTLRIAAPPLFAEQVLAEVIARFQSAWPEVEVEGRFETRPTDPFADDLDLMIRIGFQPPEAAYAVRVDRGSWVLCASPKYLENAPELVSPVDLSHHRTLFYGDKLRPWTLRRGEESPVKVELAPVLQANSVPVVLAGCREGLGVAGLPVMGLSASLAAGILVEVLPEWRFPEPNVWAVYGHRTSTDPTLAAFVKLLQETCRSLDHSGEP